LARHGASRREKAQASQLATHPIPDTFWRIICQHVHGKNARESVWMRSNGICHIRIIESVAGRRLNDSGLGNTRLVHGAQQNFSRRWAILRPSGLVTTQRRARILIGVGGDDVWMNIQNSHVHKVTFLLAKVMGKWMHFDAKDLLPFDTSLADDALPLEHV
jgi:hypothetical protein